MVSLKIETCLLGLALPNALFQSKLYIFSLMETVLAGLQYYTFL